MTIVHYLCFAWRRHLAYALLSINSLIRRGNVDPEQIMVSISEKLIDTPEGRCLQNLGVKARKIPNGFTQKLICVDEVFEQFNPDTIIQLDCDTALLEGCDFCLRVNDMAGDSWVACYRGASEGRQPWELRKRLLIDAFKPNTDEGRRRLNCFLMATYGFDLETFEAEINYWILGGLGVFRRQITEKPAWVDIQAMAWITRCDETPLRMADFGSDKFHARLLYHQDFPHDVSPKLLSFDSGRGMVHWAGDWYREHKPENRAYLEDKLLTQFGLQMPTDAPVGPFDRHAKTIPGEPAQPP